jgi:HEAT repeat protein
MKSLAFLALAVAAAAALAADAAQELAEKRAALAAKTAEATKTDLANERYRLGLWARDRGFEEDARLEFRAALAADASHEAAHAALGEVKAGGLWVAKDEAMRLKGLVERGGRWILKEEAAVLDLPVQEKARRAEEEKKVQRLLAAWGGGKDVQRRYAEQALSGVDDKYKFDPYAWGLRSRSADVRLFCAKELGRLGDRRGIRPLLWRAVHDPESDVRVASVAAAKAIGDPNLAVPLVGALDSEAWQIRANAAQALGELGARDGNVVKWLVYRFEAHGGGAPRCYFGEVRQTSFIQDFDVEVAQTAFIADPIVGVIQEGVVLDVVVVATSQSGIIVEREAYHSALTRLTGWEVKNEKGAWASWWKDHAKDYEHAAGM